MSLVMESDALYWLNWANFVYGMHFFFFGGGGGGISLFMSHKAEHQGRWDDKGTEGESEMVTDLYKKGGSQKSSSRIQKQNIGGGW